MASQPLKHKIKHPVGPIKAGDQIFISHRGRGAVSNQTGRFESHTNHWQEDGWAQPSVSASQIEDLCDDTPFDTQITTSVTIDSSRSIITRNDASDIGFDRSINPYRGCEHGCIYCFARSSHAYLGLSPGLDFETRLFAKPNAALLLRKELRQRNYVCKPLMLGSNTDPYQPIERTYRVTRQILEIMLECRHPVMILTKSALLLRDLDILTALAQHNLISTGLSITTLDPGLARIMEPRAATPQRRLMAVKALAEAGIPVSVVMAPVIPALNDTEIETLVQAAADHGADGIRHMVLRLPLEVADLFKEWTEIHFPDRTKRIFSLLQQMQDQTPDHSDTGTRKRRSNPYAAQLTKRMQLARKRAGLQHTKSKKPLDHTQFRPPIIPGDQLPLL